MDKKASDRHEVLSMFLSEIFEIQMPKQFPDLEITPEDKPLYFKIWCAGVTSGLELDEAIENIREMDDDR